MVLRLSLGRLGESKVAQYQAAVVPYLKGLLMGKTAEAVCVERETDVTSLRAINCTAWGAALNHPG